MFIGYAAFYRCDSLTSIQINSATTIIDTRSDSTPPGFTIPASATIIGHNPSTAKDFAEKYNRTFVEIGEIKTLKEIAITSPAQKLVYKVGEALELTGLVVTGTYSDGTSKVETLTSDKVTGFNSSATAANQVLTITIGGKTVTYTVKIVAGEEPVKGELTGFLGQDPAGNYYLYNKADFNNSYLAYQINPSLSGAKMYRHYMNQPCRIIALKDLTRGYMDYSATASASLSAQLRGETFDIDAYFGRSDAKIYEKAVTVVGIVDKDGNVTY